MAGFFDILAGVATSGANALFTDIMNEKNAERNNQYWNEQAQVQYKLNEKAADNAMQRTIDIYNQIQSPKAMVKQLLEAGLNPALMYSQGGMGGQVQSGPQGGSNASPTGAPTLGLQEFMDPLLMAKVKNIEADTENKEADTDKKKEETKTEQFNQDYIKSNTELNEIQKLIDQNNLQISNETINEQITIVKTSAQQAIEELNALKLENKLNTETYNDKVTKIKHDTINTITQGEIMLLEKEKLKATTENINIDTKKKEQEIQEIKWKCNLLRQEVAKTLNEVNLTYYMTLSEQSKANYYNQETIRIAEELANKYGWTFTKDDIYKITGIIMQGVGAACGISSGAVTLMQGTKTMGKIGF